MFNVYILLFLDYHESNVDFWDPIGYTEFLDYHESNVDFWDPIGYTESNLWNHCLTICYNSTVAKKTLMKPTPITPQKKVDNNVIPGTLQPF